MTKHDPHVRMLHMRDHARSAVKLSKNSSRDELIENEVLRLALTHLVELVGEAASQVPADIRARYPQIPWAKIVGMRNRLIHGYDYVDMDILWNALTVNLPELLDELDTILAADK